MEGSSVADRRSRTLKTNAIMKEQHGSRWSIKAEFNSSQNGNWSKLIL